MSVGNSTHPESNLARVFDLCERATPGPWTLPARGRLHGAIVAMVAGHERQVASSDGYAAQYDLRDDAVEIQRANAKFIAESRELVPALAAEVKALRAERDALQRRIDFMRDEWSLFGAQMCAICVYEDGKFIRACNMCKAREKEAQIARRATVARIGEWLATKAEYYKLNQHLGPYSRELAAMLDTDAWLTDLETARIAVTPDVPAEPVATTPETAVRWKDPTP